MQSIRVEDDVFPYGDQGILSLPGRVDVDLGPALLVGAPSGAELDVDIWEVQLKSAAAASEETFSLLADAELRHQMEALGIADHDVVTLIYWRSRLLADAMNDDEVRELDLSEWGIDE